MPRVHGCRMRTFSIGQLDIDVVRHVRVDGSRFPTPTPDSIADYFIVNARWQGNAIDFYPNEGRRVDPLAFGFIGKKVLPVNTNIGTEENPIWVPVGTKRGGDFRSRLWLIVARRLGKAVLAGRLGKRVGEVTDTDESGAPVLIRRLLTGDFADPVDLKTFALDDACRHLRDAVGDLEEGEKPPGTIATIDTDYDAHTSATSKNATATELRCAGGVTARAAGRFSLASITAGATINDVDLQYNITVAAAGATYTIRPYGAGGAGNPEADVAADMFAAIIAQAAYITADTAPQSTGSKTHDLGTTADSDVAAALAAGTFAIGWQEVDDNAAARIEAIENAGTDPATLTVDYTAPAAGGTAYRRTLMGVGP